MLQWGHDLAVMERTNITETGATVTWLQWGHDLAVMESLVDFAKQGDTSFASMGP